MRKRICILSFSPIHRDARVLRQIKYLFPHYDLTIIGYGHPHPEWANVQNVKWISLDGAEGPFNGRDLQNKMKTLRQLFINRFDGTFLMTILRPIVRWLKIFLSSLMMLLGRLHPWFYETWYWRKKTHVLAFEYATHSYCDVFHANDWETLPLAAESSRRNNAKLIFDAHEYAPLELENRPGWKLLFQPTITYFIEKYADQVDASITVAPLISERYKREFRLDPIVVLNTAERALLQLKEVDINNIRLVHHGGAIPDRRLECMIETLAFCDKRYKLHLMLIETHANYIKYLKKLANDLTPDRVVFHEPVPPEKIVRSISEYDIGFYLLEPNSYNNRVALPNKFFDFILAGLAVCIGPSPSMVEVVQKYGCGCVARSFSPRDLAEMINQLTLDKITTMKLASQRAAKTMNAEKEMGKLVALYDKLMDSNELNPVL